MRHRRPLIRCRSPLPEPIARTPICQEIAVHRGLGYRTAGVPDPVGLEYAIVWAIAGRQSSGISPAICASSSLLPAGVLGDRFGRRRLLISGLLLFGAASVTACQVDSASGLIATRALMGAGAAVITPTSAFPRAASRRPGADRKSTRLNSSHVSISYAVVCFKKKKNL